MSTAIFGATGHLGALVIDHLLERGAAPGEILALGRNEERLGSLAARGLQTARVDLDEPEGLSDALSGVSSVLLISTSEPGRRVPQHRAVIDAAVRAGVGRISYTSLLQAATSPMGLADDHRETEELIAASGIPATLLRNGWYIENYAPEFESARRSGEIANNVGDGRIASATRNDYAEAAAVVLTTPGHEGAVYELSGDVAWNFTEFAEAAQDALGAPVRYEAISDEEQRERLVAVGLGEDMAGLFATMNADAREGALSYTNGDLARLLGRAPEPLEQTLRSWA